MPGLKILYRSFSTAFGDRLVWKLDANRLRILCYHGLCDDRLVKEAWIPGYFVGASAFEEQLRYLRCHAQVLPLREAVERLRDGSLPPRSVSLTFDDGYANNLEAAYPLLRKYGMPATIFLATSYVESGELFPFLKLKLIQLHRQAASGATKLVDYKSAPLDEVEQSAVPWWGQVKESLTDDHFRTLRPLTIEEIRHADPALIEFGAHSHTHCILKNESDQRRREEIETSVSKVTQWTGRPSRLFSYPNGQRGDFGEVDRQARRAVGVQAAVTGIGGANDSRTEVLGLRRYPVSLYHDDAGFRAEVTGFRSAVLAATGRRTS